jgi:hypothetical protein
VSGVSNFIYQSSLPTEAETLGLYEAIKFAIAQNMSSVIFESDCKIIVDIVNSPQVPNNEISDILARFKDLLLSRNSYIVSHVRRQANKVSHTLTRAFLSHPNPFICHDVPSNLCSLIINEMA